MIKTTPLPDGGVLIEHGIRLQDNSLVGEQHYLRLTPEELLDLFVQLMGTVGEKFSGRPILLPASTYKPPEPHEPYGQWTE